MADILTQIIEKRRADIAASGLTFGIKIPEKRVRKVHPFLKDKGVILEVKRASPSKGDISPNLDSYKTARSYAECGARAISCLTETNYFKGTLEDLMKVCRAADDFEAETGCAAPAVLRKDFLLSADEVEIAYRAGADAVLLIARILPEQTFLEMAKAVAQFGMSALVEIRSDEDVKKTAFVFSAANKLPLKNFVFGVNSRDLSNFKIDLLRPCMMMKKIKQIAGEKTRIVFESGVTNYECASVVGSLGFSGLLLGEAAAKNPELRKGLVASFMNAGTTKNAEFWQEYAESLNDFDNALNPKIKICGLTRLEDALLAEKLGASFVGFVFADAFARSVTKENRLEKLLCGLGQIKAKKIAVVVDTNSPESKQAAELVKSGVFDALQFHKIAYENVSPELLALPHYFATDNADEYEKLVSKGELRVLVDSKTEKKGTWLAGGLNPQNVGNVIKENAPELIDVSGGIENENCTGIKSEEKMKEFFENAGYKKIKLMSHLVAGYPTNELALTAARSLVKGGADILEIQLPFSDPSADGPAIQTACTKVLERSYKTADGLKFIAQIHKEFPDTAIYLMSYGSLVYTPGVDEFCKKASEAGVSGMIIPDLPFDHDEGLTASCKKYGMINIPVAAPSMSADRLEKLANAGFPYIYAALRTGITGTDTKISDETISFLNKVSAGGSKVYGGFGISNGNQAKVLADSVEAIVAGSVFVRIITENQNDVEKLAQTVEAKAKELSGQN